MRPIRVTLLVRSYSAVGLGQLTDFAGKSYSKTVVKSSILAVVYS